MPATRLLPDTMQGCPRQPVRMFNVSTPRGMQRVDAPAGMQQPVAANQALQAAAATVPFAGSRG